MKIPRLIFVTNDCFGRIVFPWHQAGDRPKQSLSELVRRGGNRQLWPNISRIYSLEIGDVTGFF